jgi:hypothetical protein
MTLFDEVAREQDRQLDESRGDLDGVRRNLLAASRRNPRARAGSGRRWLAASMLAAVALGGAALVLRSRSAPDQTASMTFRVDQAAGVVGQWASASTSQTTLIRFSDGSRWVLEPGARARVAELNPQGAALTLEAGSTHVSVVHRPDSRWTVSAGPFQVLVTGTRFDLSWDPDADRFEVYLQEGAVTLKGCAFGEGRPLQQGERVTASCANGRFQVVGGKAASEAPAARPPEQEAPPSAPDPAQTADDASEAAGEREAPERPAPRVTPPPRDIANAPAWRSALDAGRYAELVGAPDAADFRAACDAASPSQLSALGDAARFAGSLDRARTAYLALRSRFAGTSTAATAAFRLGRMDFDQRLSYRQAAKWFATYLGEQPGGPLAREALGRLIEARQRSGDRAGARAAAERYLAAYPQGPHAPVARSVLGTSASPGPP